MVDNYCVDCGKRDLTEEDLESINKSEMCCACYERFLTEEQGANEDFNLVDQNYGQD